MNVKGEYVAGSIKEEAIRAFNHVFSAAKTAGFERSDIVYVDIAFSDLTEVGSRRGEYSLSGFIR